MKVPLIFMILLCIFAQNVLFSQEYNTSNQGDDSLEHASLSDSTVPRTIIRSNPFSLHRYKLSDNSPLRKREIRFLLNTVPTNSSLLKQEKGFRIASLSFLGVWGLACLGYSFSEKSPNPNIIQNISVGVQVGSVLGYVITDNMSSYKFNQAISNYNLSIMGVPLSVIVQ
jgi:hypothetical protein